MQENILVRRNQEMRLGVTWSGIITAGLNPSPFADSQLDACFHDSSFRLAVEWRFKPALGPGGKPVPVSVIIEVTFRLL